MGLWHLETTSSWLLTISELSPAVSSLSSSAAALANSYTYNSLGNLTASTGSVTNRFQYTGREFDPETTIYYYRARYYDPNAGASLAKTRLAFKLESTSMLTSTTNRPNQLIRAD